jgi:type III secretion protein T
MSVADVGALFGHAHPVLMGMPRVGAALLVMPLFPTQIVPRMVRSALCLVLVLAIYPLLAQDTTALRWDAGQWLGFTLKEIFIGGVIGYAMGLLIWALMAMGAVVDTQAGYNNAQIFDPFGGHSQGPIFVLLNQLGVFLFMTMGGLQVFLQLLFESFRLWPVSSFTPVLGAALNDLLIKSSTSMLEVTARLSAPFIGMLLLVELGIGLLNRLAPQLNANFFSMPLKALAASLVLVLLLSHLVDLFTQQLGVSSSLLQTLDAVWGGR